MLADDAFVRRMYTKESCSSDFVVDAAFVRRMHAKQCCGSDIPADAAFLGRMDTKESSSSSSTGSNSIGADAAFVRRMQTKESCSGGSVADRAFLRRMPAKESCSGEVVADAAFVRRMQTKESFGGNSRCSVSTLESSSSSPPSSRTRSASFGSDSWAFTSEESLPAMESALTLGRLKLTAKRTPSSEDEEQETAAPSEDEHDSEVDGI